MDALTLPAGTYRDRAGRLAHHDLELTPEGPLLVHETDPARAFLTGWGVDGRLEVVLVDRRVLPPEESGPEREDADPGTAYLPGDPVWVWSTACRAWRPGTVDRASTIAVQVSYRPHGEAGPVADAVPPCYVARRAGGQR